MKCKIALVIGHIGVAGGSVMGVEPVLWEALAQAGCRVGQAPAQAGWGTASRVDAGTHAVSLVVAAKVRGIAPDQVPDALNRALPPQVRVWTARHVSKRFGPRQRCAQRWYEYWMPVPANVDMGRVRVAASLLQGTHTWHNFTRLRQASIPAGMASARPLLREYVDLVYQEPDNYAKQAELFPAKAARVAFERTVYTSEVELVPGTAVPGPDGMSWLRFHFRGSAFLYEQIRRMATSAYSVITGLVEPEVLAASLGRSPCAVRWPAAPAGLLILENALFYGLNRPGSVSARAGDTQVQEDASGVEHALLSPFSPAATSAEPRAPIEALWSEEEYSTAQRWKHEVLLPSMMSPEVLKQRQQDWQEVEQRVQVLGLAPGSAQARELLRWAGTSAASAP